MRNTKIGFVLGVLLICAAARPAFGQQPERVFNWLPGNQEDVRLDPANYHAGTTYHASGDGGNMQVDIKSELPVTIFLVHAEEVERSTTASRDTEQPATVVRQGTYR